MHVGFVKKRLFAVCILCLVFCQSALATVYSNAENGAGDWVVFDSVPAGASISAVYDNSLGSQVIQTNGDGRSNSYLLGGTTASAGWNNQSESKFSWDMSTDEPFGVQVYVDTSRGVRRLTYTKSNSDSLKNPSNNTIYFGLGSATIGAGWLSHTRNLSEDVRIGEPGNTLLAVNGVAIFGSLRLDNVVLNNGGVEPPDSNPPTAVIGANVTSGNAPLTLVFSATESSAVSPATLTAYSWDFGNNTSANSSGGSTTYSQAGNYQVSLTVTDSNGLTDSTNVTITVRDNDTPPPEVDPGDAAAARLLAQATFGTTLSEIDRVRQLGIAGWIDDQLSQTGTSHLDYVSNFPGASSSRSGPRQHKWMIDAIDARDQLRNRVAFALSQIFVASDVTQVLNRAQHAMTNYYDLLRDNAFGNYRQLLEQVTLNPIMGIYLSMLQNAPGDPANNTRADENYAREIMQLFSIGLYELNNDGTIRYEFRRAASASVHSS